MSRTVAEARPRFTADEAREIAREIFGVEPEGAPLPLPSDRDQNFRLRAAEGDFALKIASANEDPRVLDLRNRLLEHLAGRDPGLALPRLRATREGEETGRAEDREGRVHRIRLLTWVPGRPLAGVRPRLPELLREIGAGLARLDRALAGFRHPAARRPLHWDLARGPGVVEERLSGIDEGARRGLVERVLELHRTRVGPREADLPAQVIHGDANDHNLLVRVGAPEAVRGAVRLSGIVDFGDAVESRRIHELAVACAYLALGEARPLEAAARVVEGYHGVLPLDEAEVAALFPLLALRLAVSVTIAAEQKADEPDRPYLTVSETGAWRLLERLDGESPDLAHYRFREACGFEPCPRSRAVVAWLEAHGAEAAPVVEPDPRTGEPLVLDFSVASDAFPGTSPETGPAPWWAEIRRRMEEADTPLALGRYDEPRPWYASEAFAPEEPGPGAHDDEAAEPRTVHLGVDLFAEPGTPVRAPLPARVHAVAHNDAPLDYGPTVILKHDAGGTPFWTLYGHLDPSVLDALEPGRRLEAGEAFAEVGTWPENGGWAPHLHLQVVVDLVGRSCDVPGVAAPSRTRLWKSLSPDPNLLLRIPGLEPADRGPPAEALLRSRRARLGAGLSVSYRRPLKIVRGWMQHLYDEEGRPHLDARNNVAHVGHAHPRVVEAEARQAATLNTNTRYLHDALVAYADRLTGLLPEPLSVCWLVCTGSEANELALRIARAATGSKETIVLDGAYHGNTGNLVEVSPYKYKGPGGGGPPPWVHEVPMPDPYRGRHRGPEAGPAYAAHVEAAAARIGEEGRGPPTLLAETLLGCGGQIEPPGGFLAGAYRAVREAGGVCIADEVQTGLGRVGSHLWAFETQGVVPDIVTLGKPLGNGHPLAAVVARPEVARAFETGMEYFNTFGGNPVSCRVGLSVLDVLEEEGLRERARTVGGELKDRLRALAADHGVIGDVRGRGLFLGVELVTDRDSRTPAPAHARYVTERMRDHRILLSTDGPDANVLKIKPPLVFGRDDALRLVAALDRILSEAPVKVEREAILEPGR